MSRQNVIRMTLSKTDPFLLRKVMFNFDFCGPHGISQKRNQKVPLKKVGGPPSPARLGRKRKEGGRRKGAKQK